MLHCWSERFAPLEPCWIVPLGSGYYQLCSSFGAYDADYVSILEYVVFSNPFFLSCFDGVDEVVAEFCVDEVGELPGCCAIGYYIGVW